MTIPFRPSDDWCSPYFPIACPVPDPRARRGLLRLFLNAPKWESAAFLLEALTDADDAVRSFASRLVDLWVENFNRSQTQPTPQQLQRIRVLLDLVAPGLSEETVRMLRFSIKPR